MTISLRPFAQQGPSHLSQRRSADVESHPQLPVPRCLGLGPTEAAPAGKRLVLS